MEVQKCQVIQGQMMVNFTELRILSRIEIMEIVAERYTKEHKNDKSFHN